MTEDRTGADIPKAYDPQAVEQRIYETWMDGGYFTPVIDRSKTPFVIVMPPPNVTGELHLGHALMAALEDLMVRWHRMKGEPALYLPGTDHAGIATQVVVEQDLAKEGLTRHDLGREAFERRVWEWVERYGGRIHTQFRRLGVSCDWSRLAFTLDPGPSKAVRTTFVNLYNKGLLYRGERITNWCSRCATALSDLEVKHQDEDAALYYIRYPLADGHGAVTVATSRPETLLGDTAVAVNPDDERYASLIGKKVVLPVLHREIPIIADSAVDPEFGTGALKVTPGHDPNDFQIGERHGLETVNVMNLDGTMNQNAGPYQGLGTQECRVKIVEELERDGLLEKREPYVHSVGHCDRCGEVVEPIVTRQWFMDMEKIAGRAREAVADGRISVIPERFAKVYYNWMDNIRDWCVSRQLWWGHRIPVWYCRNCDEVIVELEDPAACPSCSSEDIHQDPDVLDTWFSSGLWPHSTLGWPDKTDDLDYFYPGSVLETGYDILFFWVARMIMMGMENTGEVPFRAVYLHGMVLDPEGVKMSKTKGNVMDPLQLIELYGADALRFALTTGNSPGNNLRLNEKKLEGSRNFANKLWNAARFVLANLDRAGGREWHDRPKSAHRQDRWIMSRLSRTAAQVQSFMEEYQFGEAQRVLYDFLWSEYCDWYLEMAKIRLRADEPQVESPLPTLAYVLERVLRLLHPFMPFVTEEVWRALTGRLRNPAGWPEALTVAPYPEPDEDLIDEEAEADIDAVIEIVRAVRNMRAEFRIQPSQNVPATIDAPEIRSVVESEASVIKALAQVEPLTMADDRAENSAEHMTFVLGHGTLAVPMGGLVDLDRERERLSGELANLESNRDRLSDRLKDESFLQKAPEEVVKRESERLESIVERRARVVDILSRLGG